MAHPCIECGDEDPRVLEFDHRDPKKKRSGVGTLCNQGASLKRVIDEVNKCDVLCASCHRKKTARDQGWYRVVLEHSDDQTLKRMLMDLE